MPATMVPVDPGNDTTAITARVSAVVCSWNAKDSIVPCLDSLRRSGVKEIILVDAGSDDGTVELARARCDQVLRDPREGLALARNLGLRQASGDYLLNWGADNVAPPGAIAAMVTCLERHGYAGVSAVTVTRPGTWLGWAMGQHKLARFTPGARPVIGTPSLFAAETFRRYWYDDRMGHSDDSDLCERMRTAEDARFAIADVVVEETGMDSWRTVRQRWSNYGRSDHEFWTKYHRDWGLCRRLWSLSHPLRNELLLPLWRIPWWAKLGVLPFLVAITWLRYWSWLRHAWHTVAVWIVIHLGGDAWSSLPEAILVST